MKDKEEKYYELMHNDIFNLWNVSSLLNVKKGSILFCYHDIERLLLSVIISEFWQTEQCTRGNERERSNNVINKWMNNEICNCLLCVYLLLFLCSGIFYLSLNISVRFTLLIYDAPNNFIILSNNYDDKFCWNVTILFYDRIFIVQ